MCTLLGLPPVDKIKVSSFGSYGLGEISRQKSGLKIHLPQVDNIKVSLLGGFYPKTSEKNPRNLDSRLVRCKLVSPALYMAPEAMNS